MTTEGAHLIICLADLLPCVFLGELPVPDLEAEACRVLLCEDNRDDEIEVVSGNMADVSEGNVEVVDKMALLAS